MVYGFNKFKGFKYSSVKLNFLNFMIRKLRIMNKLKNK